jgi:hypothetical protein
VSRRLGPVTVAGALFHYNVRSPAVIDRASYTLVTLDEPTTTSWIESVVIYRRLPFNVTGMYAFVHSREGVGAERGDVPLTPRHRAGIDAWAPLDGRVFNGGVRLGC